MKVVLVENCLVVVDLVDVVRVGIFQFEGVRMGDIQIELSE